MYLSKNKICYTFYPAQDIHENVNLGEKISLNSNDKKVQDIVAYALLSIDRQEGSKKPHVLSKIINVSKQVKKNKQFTFISM